MTSDDDRKVYFVWEKTMLGPLCAIEYGDLSSQRMYTKKPAYLFRKEITKEELTTGIDALRYKYPCPVTQEEE